MTALTDEELAEMEKRFQRAVSVDGMARCCSDVPRLIAALRASQADVRRLETTIGFNARDPLGQRVWALQTELGRSQAEVRRLNDTVAPVNDACAICGAEDIERMVSRMFLVCPNHDTA
jgi:hypothetical protein